jgi:serine/threonine protein kinase
VKHTANAIEVIFAQAIAQRAPEERAAYLDGVCGDDAPLRARVEALLKAHDHAGSFMNSEASEDTLDQPAGKPRRPPHKRDLTEGPGTVIGPYKLLQLIGEGGFGVVYMAEQETPVRRRMALKVIKAGMDTHAVIARFEAERQALAMMDHPNIARVLDAGATVTGRPYFVMELVKGIPITQYCDEACQDTRQRLALFIDVCRAVQHAHQKGVIHRDLKPSNIMITLHDDRPVVKVIDFGIAKATDQRLTEKTLFTNYGQMIGTPAYMSPEQAVMSGLDVDTRSDIYSLGVLLYELLTGSPPFDAKSLLNAGFDEMRRIIREQQPHKPSTRVSTLAEDVKLTVANQRHASPQVLRKQLHGDLDWIVLKAIEKDRTRRYETANGLAADLKRHLDKEPVNARPPSTAYRLQKAMSRNKVAFGAGVAVVMALVMGIAGSVWQAVRANSAEKRVTAALDELRASAPAFEEQARALAAREKFDEAIEKLDYALKLRPDVAEYYVAKADLLQCQFKLAEAAKVYRAALGVKADLGRAEASAKLCEELMAAPLSADGKLTRESLAKLHTAMLKQQRPAAELLPVARLLGEEKKLVLDYWLGRFKDLPVSVERPLKDRLSVREDGRLALDLSNTKVIDLSPLKGAPIASLSVANSEELTDLSPLRGLDLVELGVGNTGVTDLTPLREMRTLERLLIAPR